jgi:SAM-dependent methyltransferase
MINCSINSDEISMFEGKKYNHTYGELTKNGIKTIIDYVIQTSNNDNLDKYTFYDLGCGSANTLKYACDITNFKKLIGIEFSKIRYKIAKQNIIDKCDIQLINNDILSSKIKYDKPKSIIYISNLCFSDNINVKLAKKLSKELKSNSIVFSSKLLPINISHKLLNIKLEQSWKADSNAYMYVINKKTRKTKKYKRSLKRNKSLKK